MRRIMGERQAEPRATSSRQPRGVVARVATGEERRFTSTFTIGSAADCDLRVLDPSVDPHHAQVLFDGIMWWVRHLGGAGGTFVDGSAVQMVTLVGEARVELGKGGPVVSLAVTKRGAQAEAPAATAPEATAAGTPLGTPAQPMLTQDDIIRRYLRPHGGEPAGKQTMMFRAAFAQVQKKSSRRYHLVIGAILAVLVVAGGVIVFQRQKLHKLQATAERVFYAMKSTELRAAQLEELVLQQADPAQIAALGESRTRLADMEGEYDAFVRELGVYAKVPERQRYMLRVARRFGECEVNVPGEFIAEVERYIERWRGNERIVNALRKAKATGIGQVVTRTFAEGNLPPHYVYLALQESNFNEKAVGPPTRYGFAKGMWQFISLTANKYGLQVGPLFDQAVYDDRDDRFDVRRATVAAAKYIRELTTKETQASGLLAMASYNWGEGNVRGLIAEMPQSPQERNFWKLLAHRRVPAETYDYVLSIFSVAVICENPGFFGFDVECPIPPRPGIDELGRDRAR
jgi:hypothetical protein